MGQTTPDALRWPEYADPAAVPQDMQELATDVQAALNKKTTDLAGKRPLTVKYSGMTRSTNIALTADLAHNITFETTYAQPSSSTPAFTHTLNVFSRFNVVTAGIHTMEFDVSVFHQTVGKASSFEIGINDGSGSTASAVYTCYCATAGLSERMRLSLSQQLSGPFYMYVKPLTAAATGWSLTYARLVLMGV